MKKAVVIGATSGIGLEVAKVLANAGWKVGIAGRRESLLSKIAEECPNIVATEYIDVNSIDASNRLSALIDKLGGMDLYFHSSGIGFQNVDLDESKEVDTALTNVVGFTRMVDAAFHYFEQHQEIKGCIAVISSIAGTKGLGAAPAYSASKRYVSHYLEALTQLAHIKKLYLQISDIRPGFVRTALLGDGGHYPLQLEADKVAKEIVRKILRGKRVIIVDWKYKYLVYAWRCIPRWIWVRMNIKSK